MALDLKVKPWIIFPGIGIWPVFCMPSLKSLAGFEIIPRVQDLSPRAKGPNNRV